MSVRTATGSLVVRHLLHGRGPALLVALLVGVLAAIGALAPLALARLSATTLVEQVDALGPVERDVTSVNPGTPPLDDAAFTGAARTSNDTWAPFLDGLETVRAGADAPVPDVLGDAQVVTRGLPLALDGDGGFALALAFDPGYRDRIVLTAGTLPDPVAVTARPGAGPVVDGPVEIVLSTATAAELGWRVGEERRFAVSTGVAAVVLTGTFDAVDPDDGVWQHARSILAPQISDDGNAPRTVNATAFADPGGLAVLFALPTRAETTIWYPTDVDALGDGSAGDDRARDAAAALRRLTSAAQTLAPPAPGTGAITTVRFTSELPDTIDRARAQIRATLAVLALTVAGPVGVAATTLLLSARLVLDRRRPALRLLSARGASRGQLRALAGAEGLVLGVVPAALVAGAVTLVAGAPPGIAWIAVAAVALVPALLLVALAGTATERAERADLGGRGSRARLVAEGVIVALAATAVALLVTRGYSTADVDPLLAVAPLLVAIAGAVIVLRLYPLPLRALLRRAERGTGATSFVGAARALREPALGVVPVLALVVGVAVAVSSGLVLATLESGIRASAEGRVGADLLVQGAAFDDAALAAIRGVDGVAAAAGASGGEPVQVSSDTGTEPASAFVVDAADLAAVQGDRAGVLPAGARLDAASGDAVPVVLSGALADRLGVGVGNGADLRIQGTPLRIVGIARGETPFSGRQSWLALDASNAERVLGSDPADRSVLVRVAPGADAAAVADGIRATSTAALRIQDPTVIRASLESGAAVGGLRVTLAAATGASAVLAALALALTLGLAGAARRRALSLLHALGAPRRVDLPLVAWEIGPPAIAALVAGSALGAALPALVLAAVDLRAFTGSSLPPAYAVDPVLLALTLGGFVVLTAVGAVAAAFAARRSGGIAALRTVGEN